MDNLRFAVPVIPVSEYLLWHVSSFDRTQSNRMLSSSTRRLSGKAPLGCSLVASTPSCYAPPRRRKIITTTRITIAVASDRFQIL